jgi:hypothetical protein
MFVTTTNILLYFGMGFIMSSMVFLAGFDRNP